MGVSNFFFFLMLIVGPVISVSASSWPLCWAGMEVGFLGLIPLLFLGGSAFSKEAALKYFCVQAMASAMMFVGGSMIFTMNSTQLVFIFLFLGGLCLKLALFPGYFWITPPPFGLEWVSCCFILGPLKVPPLGFLSEFSFSFPEFNSWVLLLASMSAVIGGILGNNQTNIRSMLGASSVTHSGWLALASVYGGLWQYLVLYLAVLFLVLFFLWQGDSYSSSLSVLSMSGLPPFIMFLAKLNVVQSVMTGDAFSWLVLPLLSAVLSLVFYLKFSYSLFLTTNRWASKFSIFSVSALNFIGVSWLLLTLFLSGRV
uniref:NADH-ubiquinone oxidoreductase chain 2 n=1 Tax=Peronia peronii TaxID=999236 RepID=G8HQX0_9EUPU|nr:NADH dehydrogenase subunit 2 [Peronia peronii]AEQ93877.1 NADH dehydrogenase subunit 2 [Peronia peronii]